MAKKAKKKTTTSSKKTAKDGTTIITTTTTVVTKTVTNKAQKKTTPVPKVDEKKKVTATNNSKPKNTRSARNNKSAPSPKIPSPVPLPKKQPTPPPVVNITPKVVTGISKGGALVDVNIPNYQDYHVVQDPQNVFNGKAFDATLNCSDLGNNNNKFYIIQVLAKDSNPNQCYFWNRWGRVGVVGQNSFSGPMDRDQAIRLFSEKLKSKTSSKYTLIEIDYSKKDEEDSNDLNDKKPKESTSKLNPKVQDFINLIYNLNIMKEQMMEVGYDANKMPLGKLGPNTLKEGYNVLKAIETELKGKKNKKVLSDLSSDFYTLIPHNFGFK